ncbi:MAG: hypothetical protein ACRDJX_08540 [Solirubrobacteraceae bacterium]
MIMMDQSKRLSEPLRRKVCASRESFRQVAAELQASCRRAGFPLALRG